MDLLTTAVTLQTDAGKLADPIALLADAVPPATALAGGRPKSAAPAHFADILGQTLAGPLFATWSPTAPLVASSKPIASSANNVAVDGNGRRDGRKRSRR
jgi:hypothetical protein